MPNIEYQWKPAARKRPQDAQTVGEAIEKITKKGGKDVPVELVAISTPKDSPTHHHFEWDNAKAGHAHRLQQARDLICALEIVIEDGDDPVRAFPSISLGDGGREFVPMRKVLSDEEMCAQLVAEAKADAVAWSKRYEHLKSVAELHGVFKAIQKATRSPVLA